MELRVTMTYAPTYQINTDVAGRTRCQRTSFQYVQPVSPAAIAVIPPRGKIPRYKAKNSRSIMPRMNVGTAYIPSERETIIE